MEQLPELRSTAPARLEVIEHQPRQVERCGQKQQGKYPDDERSSVQYGSSVRALVVKLSVGHKMPLEQIGVLFQDSFGYELNSETMEKAMAGFKPADSWPV